MSTLAALPPAALIVFRESLEAGLVSAVILAYLRRFGRGGYVKFLYWGVLGDRGGLVFRVYKGRPPLPRSL